MSVAIVVDSAAALPPELAADHGIIIVPLLMRVGDREYADGELPLRDLMDVPPETVSTSGATPAGFEAAIGEADAAGNGIDGNGTDGVLILTLAATMSATYEAARLAAADVTTPTRPVRVLDTATAAGAEGLVAIHAARAARRGLSLDAVEAAARDAIASVRLVATVDSLDRLVASGRVSGLAARAGRLVNVNPLFEFRGGEVRSIRPAFTREAALDRIVARWRRSRPEDAALHVVALHAIDEDAADHLMKRVVEEVSPATAFIGAFSSVMVANTGGGLAGLAWWWEPTGQASGASTGTR
ncbi:MAG TPA: DegV family protein [Acidimicrobiia bacterium]|nr:DegV family protein [Acidimicrobiia bacterium]